MTLLCSLQVVNNCLCSVFQVGKFYEFYHHQDDKTALSLGLRRMRTNRCGVRFGFPVLRESFYCQLVLRQGLQVLFVRETGVVLERLRQRLPSLCVHTWLA